MMTATAWSFECNDTLKQYSNIVNLSPGNTSTLFDSLSISMVNVIQVEYQLKYKGDCVDWTDTMISQIREIREITVTGQPPLDQPVEFDTNQHTLVIKRMDDVIMSVTSALYYCHHYLARDVYTSLTQYLSSSGAIK